LFALAVSVVMALSFSGDILSGAQTDVYGVNIEAGKNVVATLVCDFDGVSRPLDPVLTVVGPGGNVVAFNDDGFGSDDAPNGVDCDAFDSSRVGFTASETGLYQFRADGFGSATGPYTLTIRFGALANPFDDGRVNNRMDKDEGALVAVYCTDDGMDLYGIDPVTAQGTLIARATKADIEAVGIPAEGVATIVSVSGATLSRASNGEFVLYSAYPDGKPYVIAWTDCDSSTVHDIQN
jgi:hypothetical protein